MKRTKNGRFAYGGKKSVATINNHVRFMNVKIGVRRRKSRDGVVVSMSARQAGGLWFNSRSQRNQLLNAYFYLFIFVSYIITPMQ